MKTSELRIGNLVDYGTGREPQRITGKDLSDGIEDRPFKPIELTEEWLKKFGFELIKESNHNFPRTKDLYDETKTVKRLDRVYALPSEDNGIVSYDRFEVLVILDPERLFLRNIRMKNHQLPTLQFVHQLQNAFFVLEEEELELERKPKLKLPRVKIIH